MKCRIDPDWGDHCCDMWRRHLLAQTGFDIERVFGPSPRSAREAAAIMRRFGVRSLSGVVSTVHGAPLSSARAARRGDIVRIGWALGICRGELAEFYGGVMERMNRTDQAWSKDVKHTSRSVFGLPPIL